MLSNNETEKIIPKAGYLYTYKHLRDGDISYCLIVPRTPKYLVKFYDKWGSDTPKDHYLFIDLKDNVIYHRTIDQIYGKGLENDNSESDHRLYEIELLSILNGWEE